MQVQMCSCCGRPKRPAGVLHPSPDCPAGEIDRQGGVTKGGVYPSRRSGLGYSGAGKGTQSGQRIALPDGTASRYFPLFRYQPKPSRREREAGLGALPYSTLNRVNAGGLENEERFAPVEVKNNHPTVKSKKLMHWLIQLITRPGGIVLDPFAGSGSTGVAAVEHGFSFLGIEQDEHFVTIARARIEHAFQEAAGQMTLFEEQL